LAERHEASRAIHGYAGKNHLRTFQSFRNMSRCVPPGRV
jgi:hypothetical protein